MILNESVALFAACFASLSTLEVLGFFVFVSDLIIFVEKVVLSKDENPN
jgi:hypothetical protein